MPFLSDFPQDGRVWIVFRIDDPRPRGAAAFHPTIAVTLRPVPETLDRSSMVDTSRLLCDPGGPDDVTVRVPLALAPSLRMGDFWRDGDFDGRGPWAERVVSGDDGIASPQRRADARARYDTLVEIGIAACVARIRQVGGQNPALWQPMWAARVGRPECSVEIPAFELFRAFFAVDPRMADAMLSGPWSKTRSALVDEAALTDAKARGALGEVPLRPGIPASLAPFLQPLLHDPLWEDAAEALYTERLRLFAAEPTRDYAPMTVRWPFDPAARRLVVRGFPHPHGLDAFVALEIVGYDWAGPDRLVLPERVSSAGQGLVGGLRVEHVGEDGPGPVIHMPSRIAVTMPQAEASPPVAMPTPRPSLGRAPVIERAGALSARPAVARGDGPLIRRRVRRPTLAHDAGATAAVAASGAAPQRRCPRFQEVMHAMARARAVGGLRRFGVVPAANPWQTRDGVSVWSCPDQTVSQGWRRIRASWSFLPGEAAEPVRRAALVLEVEAPSGAPLLSITLEPGPSPQQTFCSLIFPAPARDRAKLIGDLLQCAVDCRGVWPEDAAFAAAFGVDRFVKWRHVSRPVLPEDAVAADATISSWHLMRRIREADTGSGLLRAA